MEIAKAIKVAEKNQAIWIDIGDGFAIRASIDEREATIYHMRYPNGEIKPYEFYEVPIKSYESIWAELMNNKDKEV